ncbi:hypothetical protein BD769DRAFT_1388717 [Suillus cothurnatus]|nr:hypothetical protein BD769DRAFT_1388717 [Suillus cothurnatus]
MSSTDSKRVVLVSLVISEVMSMLGMNVTIRIINNQCHFYPLLDSVLTPDIFLAHVITTLTNNTGNPLAFMHKFTVDVNRNITMIDQLNQLNYAIAAIGAAVKLMLWEQLPHLLVIIPFTQLEGKETFNNILHYIGDLDGVQNILFNIQKSHMLSVGDSQVLLTNLLAQLDIMMIRVQ